MTTTPAEHLAADDLRELLNAVAQTSERLQATHSALHAQVARLQGELVQANAQLRRSQSLAALGEMAAGIAHEVRNPLASIHLYAQMLSEDLADRPGQAELCHKITRAVVGLDAIVRDVLSFARETSVHPELLDVAELVARALDACESLIRTGGITLVCEPLKCPQVLGDPNLLHQALSNVIRNAAEALIESDHAERRLTITCTRRRLRCPDGQQGTRCVLSVSDNGPGIPDDVIERVFNPFFTTRKTGTGLGLAIVHRIIDAHGGHVAIRSSPPGESGAPGGTTVSLCLPATRAAVVARSSSDTCSSTSSTPLHLEQSS